MLITESHTVHLALAGTRERKQAQRWWQQAKDGHTRAFYLYHSQERLVRQSFTKPTAIPELCFEIGSIRGAAARKRHQQQSKGWL